MRKVILSLSVLIIYIVLNIMLDNYISNFRDNFFIGEYSIYSTNQQFDFINIGRSNGADSFSWENINDYSGINFGMAGKPLSTDLILLEFYEDVVDEHSVLLIPITFNFFCSDETPYTPFETIYKFDYPLLGMVQSNATIEYVLKSKGLRELTTNRNNTIPVSYIPEQLYSPEICDNDNLSLYVDLINSLKIDKENVVLMITPHYMDFALDKEHEGFRWYYNKIDVLIDVTNINFLDYSDLDLIQDKNYFNDFQHLNQKGRDLFTRYFVNEFIKHG
jgi:hypothetical protein